MHKRISAVLCSLALAATLSSCYSLDHQVGTGAQGGAKTEKRAWYFLFGLVPLNEVDSKELSNGATNYDVKSEINFLDVVLNLFTGWVTIYSQTVTVTK